MTFKEMTKTVDKMSRETDAQYSVVKFYNEYSALNCDAYQLDEIQQAVYSDNNISDAEAFARLAALSQLEAETFEFNPACCD